jgi:hypothetical protein
MADTERKPAFEVIGRCACPGHKCAFLRTTLSDSDAVMQEAADGINSFADTEGPIALGMGRIEAEMDATTEEISGDVFWVAELPGAQASAVNLPRLVLSLLA